MSKLFNGNSNFCGVVAPETHYALAEAGLCMWPHKRITYHEDLIFATLARPRIVEAYDQAWRQWEDVCDIEPTRLASAVGANVVAGQGRIDGPGSVLATSYLPCGVDANARLTQNYDDTEAWDSTFLRAVACHEIGHALGLPHLAIGNLMAPVLNLAITKPQIGDIVEIQARYGRPVVMPTPTPTPAPIPTPIPTPVPTPAPTPEGFVPTDGQFRDYHLEAGERKPFRFMVPGAFLARRKDCVIGTRGSMDTVLELYGFRGNLIATADSGGARGNARLAKKLFSGVYTVVVSAKGGHAGVFRLMVSIS